MKYCSNCGKALLDGDSFCPGCGTATKQEPKIESPVFEEPKKAPVEEKANVGLCILSFFIPLFGIIYWAVMNSEQPKTAKACGITALVSWGVGILVSVLCTVGAFVLPLMLPFLMMA